MNNSEFTIGHLLKEQGRSLGLELVLGERSLDRPITVSEINRPGLALAGFLEHFRSERIQVIGKGEQAYCSRVEASVLRKALSKMLTSPKLPCVIATHNLKLPAVLKEECERRGVPLLRSKLETATLVSELSETLEAQLAPSCLVHGVFVDIYGLGVLIQGDAGMGKSECALELLKRGHILIADDVVRLQHRRGEVLRGSCPEPLKNHMEVRGLGVLDIRLLFGIGLILEHKRVRLAIQLLPWKKIAGKDRTGLENDKATFLGVEVPLIRIPVSSGRNLAVLIEVAALNQRLKSQGYSSAENFNRNLIERMGGANKK